MAAPDLAQTGSSVVEGIVVSFIPILLIHPFFPFSNHDLHSLGPLQAHQPFLEVEVPREKKENLELLVMWGRMGLEALLDLQGSPAPRGTGVNQGSRAATSGTTSQPSR